MPVDNDSQEYIDFKELKTQTSVSVILASLGLLDALELRDNELIGECMLGSKHGKSDSFSFNLEKKAFQCFSCKQRGSVLDFCAKQLGTDATLHDGARYVKDVMDRAYELAGEDADDDMLVAVIADETDSKKVDEPRAKQEPKPTATDQAKTVQPLASDKPLNVVDMQNAVMSWSLASYRVADGKLNPDDLIVVDVATMEFLRQLTQPEKK